MFIKLLVVYMQADFLRPFLEILNILKLQNFSNCKSFKLHTFKQFQTTKLFKLLNFQVTQF